MFRQIMKLAFDAAKVEAQHIVTRAKALIDEPTKIHHSVSDGFVEHVPAINEVVEVVPAPSTPPTPATPSTTTTPYLDKVRADARCPFCAEPKTVGEIMCTPCDDFRKPLRAKAEKTRQARATPCASVAQKETP